MACANIGGNEISKRRWMGGILLAFGLLDAYLLIRRQVALITYSRLLIPFFFAGLGFFQASRQVCVYYARQGVTKLNQSIEPIADPKLAADLKLVSRGIYYRSLVFAAAGSLAAACLSILFK